MKYSSRDREKVEKIVDDDRLSFIVRLAGLVSEEEARQRLNHQINYQGMIFLLYDLYTSTVFIFYFVILDKNKIY